MWKIILLCVLLGIMDTQATAAKKQYVKSAYAGSGSYAGAAAGAGATTGGYTGGYVGGYTGTGVNDQAFVATNTDDYDDYDSTGSYYAPDFGLSAAFLDPYVFHQQLTAQIQAQHAAQQNAIYRQVAAQQAYFDNIRRRNHIHSNGYSSNRYAPSYASASGSIGPGGYFQSASVNPSNPNTPNIVNRFSSSSSPGGYKGVSVSSYASSSDINGKKSGVRGAQTTINDNGKVTSYSVHS